MDFPKKQQQCLIPRYLLQYLTSLQLNHDDPTAPWGGGGGGTYTAGDGIEISDEDVISIDDTVALKSDIPSLTGYATETWVTNQGYLVQSDLSDYVTSSELITELGNYVTSTDLAAELLNYAELDDIPTKTSDLTNDSGFITSSALTGYATESWVSNQGYSTFSGSYNDLTDTPDLSVYELAADAFSGNYNDLTNKPSIPSVSGNYSGSYWTRITINGTTKSIPSGDSVPTNMVTTNTDQNITGVKTFVGKQKIRFKQQTSSETLGFTAYDNGNYELGNLQIANRTVGGSTYPYVTLGNFSARSDKSKIGFRIQPNSSSNSYNFIMPYGTDNDFTDNTYSTTADTTIPCAFTDGTTIVKADATGIVDLSSLNLGGSSYTAGTGIDITNDVISVDSTVVALKTDIPTDYVDLSTDQEIDGVKTFLDRSIYSTELNTVTNTSLTNISFKETNQSSTRNIGAIVAQHNSLRFNGDSSSRSIYFTAISDMGYAQESYAGFYVAGDTLYDKLFVAPHPSYSAGWDSAYPDKVYYIPMVISDGTTNYYANEQGIVTIPSGGSSYTAGTGIDITNDVISIDSTVVALKTDIPTVPTNVSAFTNDAGYVTKSVNDLTNYTLSSNLATVATSGSYNDLTNKPSIPDAVSGTNDGTNWTSLTIGSDTYGIPSGGGGGGSYESNLYLHKMNFVFSYGNTYILRGEMITEYPDEILTFAEFKRQLNSIVDTQFGNSRGYTFHQFNGVFMKVSNTISYDIGGAEYVIGIQFNKSSQQINLIEMGRVDSTSVYTNFSSSYNPYQNYKVLSGIVGDVNATYAKDVVLPFIRTSS